MKVYAYGDVTCRGEITPIKVEFDTDQVREYMKIKKYGDEEQLDNFLEGVGDFDTAGVISMFGEEHDEGQSLLKVEKGEAISLMGEEELVGVALTKRAAKVKYAEANVYELNDDW